MNEEQFSLFQLLEHALRGLPCVHGVAGGTPTFRRTGRPRTCSVSSPRLSHTLTFSLAPGGQGALDNPSRHSVKTKGFLKTSVSLSAEFIKRMASLDHGNRLGDPYIHRMVSPQERGRMYSIILRNSILVSPITWKTHSVCQ